MGESKIMTMDNKMIYFLRGSLLFCLYNNEIIRITPSLLIWA